MWERKGKQGNSRETTTGTPTEGPEPKEAKREKSRPKRGKSRERDEPEHRQRPGTKQRHTAPRTETERKRKETPQTGQNGTTTRHERAPRPGQTREKHRDRKALEFGKSYFSKLREIERKRPIYTTTAYKCRSDSIQLNSHLFYAP